MRRSAKLRGRRGPTLLLVMAVVAAVLLLPAAALAATPTVTIVGPSGFLPSPSASPSPTAAAPAVNDSRVDLYLNDNGWGAKWVRFSNDGGTTWSVPTLMTGIDNPPYEWWYLYDYLGGTAIASFDGTHTVTAQFSDSAVDSVSQTWGATSAATTLLDTQSPVATAPEGYWNNNYPYELSARDQVGLSGVAQLWYGVDAGAMTIVKNAAPLGTSDPLATTFALAGGTGARHTIYYAAADYAGNTVGLYGRVNTIRLGAVKAGTYIDQFPLSSDVVIDRTAPTTTARGADNHWHPGPVTVSFSATDGGMAGVDYIEYSITPSTATEPADWTTGDSVAVSQPGEDKVWYRAVDTALPEGNVEAAKYVQVRITPTRGPKTEAQAVKASAGKAFDLHYKISDPYSTKAKSVTILVKDASGTVVKTIDLGSRSLGKWHSVSCTLAMAGAYKYVVHAKDTAGVKQRNPVGKAKLTIK